MSTFGDVRDVLVQLPRNPWGGYEGSYVESDIFPTKHSLIRSAIRGGMFRGQMAVSALEIGALCGFFLVTALEAIRAEGLFGSVAWIDSEKDVPGSNQMCLENIEWWVGYERGESKIEFVRVVHGFWKSVGDTRGLGIGWGADIVHVDGEHTYHACLVDLGFALAVGAKLILVDDTGAIPDVRRAVDDFCSYGGFEPSFYETVNGFASIVI